MQKNGFLKQFTIIGGGTFFNLLLGLIPYEKQIIFGSIYVWSITIDSNGLCK